MGAVMLPEPRQKSGLSIEQALLRRRSQREFSPAPLELMEVGQLVWAAQGISSREGLRTAPSAGALYPLEVYLAAGHVTGLEAGVYRYDQHRHRLVQVTAGDKRNSLADAAWGQAWVAEAPVVIVLAAVYECTTAKYGRRGLRYVHMEAGHAAQNLCLQGVSLGLGTTTVGAFSDDEVKRALGLTGSEAPLYLLPVGRPR
ncbi:MAG TPA: SagB/ThcOx family dehydrogenase [Chromatiales bacterium]|nr:SagB/ThcOx family dehydrogenase [Chromatiales bacterium]